MPRAHLNLAAPPHAMPSSDLCVCHSLLRGARQPRAKGPVLPASSAPLVVFPFEQERFLSGDGDPAITWDHDLETQAFFYANVPPSTLAQSTMAFGRAYAFMVAIAFGGAFPRVIALLILREASRTVPISPELPNKYQELMQTCVAGSMFTDFSLQGHLYKALGGIDHNFGFLGLTFACLAGLHGTFPSQTTRGGRIIMMGFTVAVLCIWISATVISIISFVEDSRGTNRLFFQSYPVAMIILFAVASTEPSQLPPLFLAAARV